MYAFEERNRALARVWLFSFSFGKSASFFFLSSWRHNTQERLWGKKATKLWNVGARCTANWLSNKKTNTCLCMTHHGELWWRIIELFVEFLVIFSIASKNLRHSILKTNFWFQFEEKLIPKKMKIKGKKNRLWELEPLVGFGLPSFLVAVANFRQKSPSCLSRLVVPTFLFLCFLSENYFFWILRRQILAKSFAKVFLIN